MAIAAVRDAAVARPAVTLARRNARSSSASSRRFSGGRRPPGLFASSLAPSPRSGRSPCSAAASDGRRMPSSPSGEYPAELRDLHVRRMVEAFDPGVPLPQAFTPPARDVHFVVCRDAEGRLRAFHNVCRHHASLLARGTGRKLCFVCPYHGWTYGLDGALLKATRVSGIQNFSVDVWRLWSYSVECCYVGPFVLVNMDEDSPAQVEAEWLGSCSEILRSGIDSSLKHVCRREYAIECNWKVFCDNYLDGGYHVPTRMRVSRPASTSTPTRPAIQNRLDGGDDLGRLGSKALYAFVYPNFMINRYGPWMDTNLVVPEGARRCRVIFDYFLDAALKDDDAFIEKSLEESETVQMEDVDLCEGVQKGLESPAYCSGRYAPGVEQAMHHFHCLLHESLTKP
ncbi:unnamed protein product [Spirodela intermedia]|uniref:Choline monooxygenase, chloroplastic n=1 Tax=Spirodela intermedia TaxID=51605 RepID=A0A7I8JJV0_SPIIN|nr:unnamed protein product [Spirodela intermedia]CAA6670350.1 unnamed protein product [Spirodela intermedia]